MMQFFFEEEQTSAKRIGTEATPSPTLQQKGGQWVARLS